MDFFNIKKTTIIINIISNLFIKVICQYNPPDEDLERFKREFDRLINESELQKSIIHVLIGTNIFLFIIILSITLYEIIKCFQRRNININNMKKNKNNNSNLDVLNVKKSVKSFNSSKMLESVRSNNEDYINSNNYAQKSNIVESNNSFKERVDNGYEAPLPEDYSAGNKEKVFLTNNDIEMNNKKEQFLNNPYSNEE